MGFTDFLGSFQAVVEGASSRLYQRLMKYAEHIDLYWYPGSGDDLSPLVLDVPGNPIGQRLLRMNADDAGRVSLLFMNDYSKRHEHFPEQSRLDWGGYRPGYRTLWDGYSTAAEFTGEREEYLGVSGIRFTLFSVKVHNAPDKPHYRGVNGDEYIVVFTECESERLLESVIIPYRLPVNTVALVRQGGLSGGRRYFWQYIHVPEMLVNHEHLLGPVSYWLIDAAGQSDKKPRAEALWDCDYVGGPVRWGWRPARIYARPETPYVREPRTMLTMN